jgi:putative redox protein
LRTVTVSWDRAGGRFTASGSDPDQTITINAPRAPGETRGSTGFSATELLLAGAGACSAWDVVEILRKRRAQITSLDVAVEGEQQVEAPWSYRRVTLHYSIAGEGLRPEVIARVIRLSITRYCSVITTIAGVAAIAATYELTGADGSGSGRQPIELALPAVPLPDVAEPTADEDEDQQSGLA